MTLPTRPDGGIDYNAFAEKMGYSNGDEALAFMRLAATHTRERCAKWHDEQEARYLKNAKEFQRKFDFKSYESAFKDAEFHKGCAAAIRKMEP